MTSPVALQLYTVRDLTNDDFEKTVRRVAEIGYAGVETAGFPGTTPEKAARLFASLGLEVPSAHLPMPVGDHKQQALDIAGALGIKRLVAGMGPDRFKTVDLIREACDLFNEAGAAAAKAGLSFGIHNHWWEFLTIDGRLVCDIMVEHLDPQVFFEIDIYWVQTGGADPATVVKNMGNRAPILHIKDGPCDHESPMTAVGDGRVDIPGVIAAGKPHTEWLIVEMDRCATDMMEAVRKSYTYLTENGLGKGSA